MGSSSSSDRYPVWAGFGVEVCVILLPLLIATAPAYELAGVHWPPTGPDTEVAFSLNAAGAPAGVEQAIADALRVWTAQGGAPVRLVDAGPTTITQYGDGSDHSNTLLFSGPTTGTTLGVSVRTTVESRIIDCDVQFFSENSGGPITWNTDAAGAPEGEFALRHTAVHELGHCLGLGHSSVNGALMEPTTPSGQGPETWLLHPDDRAGLQAIYGVAEPIPTLVEARSSHGHIELQLVNDGPDGAYDLFASLPGAASTPQRLGDLLSGEELVAELPFDEDASCEPLDTELLLTDAAGAAWSLPVRIDRRCGLGGGCATSPPPSSGLALLLLLPALRRRKHR